MCFTIIWNLMIDVCIYRCVHDDVTKWKHFPRDWPLWGESTVHRWFRSQKPVMRSFDVFFDMRLNKRWSKQSRLRWFETPSRSLWRHCIVYLHFSVCVCACIPYFKFSLGPSTFDCTHISVIPMPVVYSLSNDSQSTRVLTDWSREMWQ